MAPRRIPAAPAVPTEPGRVLATLAVAALAWTAVLAGCGDATPVARRNVVVITTDTTRADVLGAYGSALGLTPYLDALARRGVVFERAYAPMAQTLPSHATLFTGLPPRAHGSLENHYQLDERVETLAERLAAEGFHTAGFIGALVLEPPSGIAQGFEAWTQPAGANQKGMRSPDRAASEVTDDALAWLNGTERRRDAPFFIWAHYFDPHREEGGYQSPEGFKQRVPGEALMTMLEERATSGQFPPEVAGRLRWFAEEWRGYAAAVAAMDEQIGRLVDGLAAAGLFEETVIVVAGDHGEGLMEHGELQHGVNIFEELVHVPLIVLAPGDAGAVLEGAALDDVVGARWPAGEMAGRRVATAVGLEQVLPMLLLLAVADEDADESLWTPLRKGAEPRPDPVFIERPHYTQARLESRGPKYTWGVLAGVVLGRYKLLDGPDGVELYDLVDDPGETRNVSRDHPQTVQRMRSLLNQWTEIHRTGEPGSGGNVSAERAATLEQLGYGGAVEEGR